MKNNSFFRSFSINITWAWLAAFAIIPNLALILVALLDRGESSFFLPEFTLANFARLFSPEFATVMWDSLTLAALSTLMCLLIGYPFAYAIAKAAPKRRPWLLLLVIIPFWTNSLIRTYALILILGAQGMINKLLAVFGIAPLSLMFSEFAIFVGLTYTLLPFMILPLYASIEKLDTRLLDAARDLGASSRRAFWHVALPLTSPGIVAGCILVFLPSLGMFYVPEILGGATNLLLGSFIKNQFLVAKDWPFGAAASSVLTIMLIVMAIIYRMVGTGKSQGASLAGR